MEERSANFFRKLDVKGPHERRWKRTLNNAK
jgi:hypothetical protein